MELDEFRSSLDTWLDRHDETLRATHGAGATLDASGRSDGALSLAAGQTLTGSGAVRGNVTVSSGAAFAPGKAAITTVSAGAPAARISAAR